MKKTKKHGTGIGESVVGELIGELVAPFVLLIVLVISVKDKLTGKKRNGK